MELLERHIQDGYFAVKTSAGEEGYVWSTSVRVSAAPIGVTTTFAVVLLRANGGGGKSLSRVIQSKPR